MRTLAETAAQLRQGWADAIAANHRAQAALHAFDSQVSEANAEHLVPPGHAIDYLGDGTIKRADLCAKGPPPLPPK